MTRAEKILYGSNPTEGIVAVETGPDFAKLYRRVDGAVVTEDREFKRWVLLTEKHPLKSAIWTELDGTGFKFLAEFPDRSTYAEAHFWLRSAHILYIAYPGMTRQYLTRTGQTLFKGMAFDDVVRLQLDIETKGLDPKQPENSIIMVAISDNRGFERIISGDERSILKTTVECVQDRDPDIIEGHNIYGFDLPFLLKRAERHGIKLAFGRDRSEAKAGAEQVCAIGYYSRPFVPVMIHGRHVLDTLFAVQRYDVSRGILSGYSLKVAAQTLGISEEDREIIPHEQIALEWEQNPERVAKYALQDVRETKSLAELVSPPDFYLTQIVPDTFSRAAVSGTGDKINSILIREYLRHSKAVPKPLEPKPLPGGYTDVRVTGVVNNIVKCDVESLYPSIMLGEEITPKSDSMNVFLPALSELTKQRLDAKAKTKTTEGRERAYWDGIQSAFKILINSFYGYLAGPFSFNDYDAAARVTTTGQSIVKQIVDELEARESTVVEIDTDGVYFKPPANIDTEEKELEYIESISKSLPEYVHLAHDGRYKAMISLKMKNYVLATYNGKKIFKGSALRSRSDEPFGLEFLTKASDYLLEGKPELAQDLYKTLSRQIDTNELGVDQITRRERVTDKTFSSPSRRRIAEAIGEAKIGEYVLVYQRKDGSLGLASSYNMDEDKEYLHEKLYKFACRLREAFGENFELMFPKPSDQSRLESAGQQKLGLFD